MDSSVYGSHKKKNTQASATDTSVKQLVSYSKTEVDVQAVNRLDIYLGVVMLLILAVIFGAYFSGQLLAPNYHWALALQENADKTKLYVLDWKDEFAMELGESQGDWLPKIQLTATDPKTLNILKQSQYSGWWNGGAAILLPESEKMLFAFRKEDTWQVNWADLKTNKINVLSESADVEPFISVAPLKKLVAISTPITDEKTASLKVFSLGEGTEVAQLVNEGIGTHGVLAPNGEHILYTLTITKPSTNTTYLTTLYLANVNGENKRNIYEFEHVTFGSSEDYPCNFTLNSEFVVCKIATVQLYSASVDSPNTATIFTPTLQSTPT